MLPSRSSLSFFYFSYFFFLFSVFLLYILPMPLLPSSVLNISCNMARRLSAQMNRQKIFLDNIASSFSGVCWVNGKSEQGERISNLLLNAHIPILASPAPFTFFSLCLLTVTLLVSLTCSYCIYVRVSLFPYPPFWCFCHGTSSFTLDVTQISIFNMSFIQFTSNNLTY